MALGYEDETERDAEQAVKLGFDRKTISNNAAIVWGLAAVA